MFKVSFMAAAFLMSMSLSAQAQSPQVWSCSGTDDEFEVRFGLLFSEFDRGAQDFSYKTVTFFMNDQKGPEMDLADKTVSCGYDDEGKVRKGRQEYAFNPQNGRFTFYSGCENEAYQVQGRCSLTSATFSATISKAVFDNTIAVLHSPLEVPYAVIVYDWAKNELLKDKAIQQLSQAELTELLTAIYNGQYLEQALFNKGIFVE